MRIEESEGSNVTISKAARDFKGDVRIGEYVAYWVPTEEAKNMEASILETVAVSYNSFKDFKECIMDAQSTLFLPTMTEESREMLTEMGEFHIYQITENR